MINNKYARAYKEVLEIIKYFPEEDYKKIPSEVIEFYKNNMDTNYRFSINPYIDLGEQNISKEANGIMIKLYLDYFATEKQKIKINEILKMNEIKAEEEKKKKYNSDDIFKKKIIPEEMTTKISSCKELIEYNETFFNKFKKFIFRILHIEKE